MDAATPVDANNRAHSRLQNRADAVSHSDHSHHPLLHQDLDEYGNADGYANQRRGIDQFFALADNDGDDDPLSELKRDIATLRGRAALVETTSAGWAEGRAAAPAKDWLVRRLGAAPPDSLIELRQAVTVTIASACGIPPVLMLDGGDGTARREAFRQFLHAGVQPVAALVEGELTEKLEQPVRLTFAGLHAADVTGRARAWRSLIGAKGEMSDADARRLTGLD